MSTFVRNNFKLFHHARLRLFHNFSNCYVKNLRLVGAQTGSITSKGSFTSIAHNVWPISESSGRIDYSKTTNSSDFQGKAEVLPDIDTALIEIDFAVKRTGRTTLESVNKIFEMIQKTGFTNQTQSLYLLRCCGLMHLELPSMRVEVVQKIWNKLQELGVQFTVKHYNALLKVYLDSNHIFTPSDVLVSMENKCIEPNQKTYLHLIEKYCRDADLNGANEILECIKEKGISVNEEVFNSLIKGHMKINDESGAKQIMEVMRSSNIPPTENSYTILACCFAEKGDIEKVEKILSEAESKGITFTTDNYLQIILSLPCNEHPEFADKVLIRIDKDKIWRQHFINTAAELIYKNMDNVAYKLVKWACAEDSNNAANVFIKQLIKVERPKEKIIEYCQEILDNNLNSYVFTNAAKACIQYGKFDYVMDFFLEMQKRGIPVRTYNFRELFSNKNSSEGIWTYLKCMSELGLLIDYYTYLEFLIPAINTKDPEKTLSKIQQCGQTVLSAVDPLFHYYCSTGEIKNAFHLLEHYPVGINTQFNVQNFISLYDGFKQDSSTFFKVLKYILENIGLPSGRTFGFRGEQLAKFLMTNPNLFDEFHKFSVGQSYNYHPQTIEVCKAIIKRENPKLMAHLRVFENNNKSKSEPLRKVSFEEEEDILQSDKNQNPTKRAQLMDLLTLHLKNKDVERLNRVIAELDKLEFVFSPTVLSQIFFLQCEMNHLEAATDALTKLKNLYPTFKVDTARLIDYARLLLKYSKFDEAMNVIKNDCKEINSFTLEENLKRSIRRFFNNVVQMGDIKTAKSVQDLLMSHISSPALKEVILEPLLKIHIYNKDMESCLKEYKSCVSNFHCSPCLNLLLKNFILSENHSQLQELVDLASKCEGSTKVLHKLAIAFIELDRLQQAIKVIQRLDRDVDFIYLAQIGMQYQSLNKSTELENLLYVTSGLVHDSRKVLYHHLLKLHSNRNDFEKVAQVLDLMKKEQLEPTKDTKSLVNGLFQRNNQPLPYSQHTETHNSELSENIVINRDILNFSNFLKQRNGDKALDLLSKMKKGYVRTIPFQELANFVDLLIEKNLLDNLSTNVNAMSYIIENSIEVFKTLIDKYATEGNVKALQSISGVFPDFCLRKLSFNSYIAKAYFASNQHENLLTELESRWNMKNKLFSNTAFEELIKIPQFEDRVINLAKKYLQADNFELPISVVWSHYFTSERYEKADEIIQIHPIHIERVDSMILRTMRQTQNINMGYKFIKFVNDSNAKDRNKERAYGALLDLLVVKQMFDDAVDVVRDAQSKNIALDKHYSSTLITLKSYLEGKDKPVPFTISLEGVQV